MSKYGFDEKELRKTIVTMIDKDGFHKEVVTYGNESYSSDDANKEFNVLVDYDSGNRRTMLVARNLPEVPDNSNAFGCAFGYAYAEEYDYEHAINDMTTITDLIANPNAVKPMMILKESKIVVLDPTAVIDNVHGENYSIIYYNIYACVWDGLELHITDRVKATSIYSKQTAV